MSGLEHIRAQHLAWKTNGPTTTPALEAIGELLELVDRLSVTLMDVLMFPGDKETVAARELLKRECGFTERTTRDAARMRVMGRR